MFSPSYLRIMVKGIAICLLTIFYLKPLEVYAQKSEAAKRLYVEAVIYRSKTEGTDKYRRKFEIISAAGIERHYKSVIDERLRKVDEPQGTLTRCWTGWA